MRSVCICTASDKCIVGKSLRRRILTWASDWSGAVFQLVSVECLEQGYTSEPRD